MLTANSVQLATFVVCVMLVGIRGDSHGDDQETEGGSHSKAQVVYQWNIIEYDWPNASMKQEELDSGRYVPKDSAVNGIKLYKGKVYVTVPRLKGGVPSTLNVVVENTSPNMTSATHILRPFPNWEMQKLGDCNALQIVQSMEIDPKTGYMWIIDTGYKGTQKGVDVKPLDACPPKIVIYDINNQTEVRRYSFPTLTIGLGRIYLNDIVLGYFNGSARYAYISDTLDYKLIVYDYLLNESYAYSHRNMEADKQYENVTISNITVIGLVTGINGIGMSPDFKYLYYSSVAGVGLHQIETSVLTTSDGNSGPFAAAVRTVGQKVSPGDGMAYGSKNNLYYSALGSNAVYKWDISKDLGADNDYNKVGLKTQSKLVSDSRMDWVDTLALDEKGYLWFTTSRLNKFFSDDGIAHDEPNFFIWKVFVDDYNYLGGRAHDPETLGTASVSISLPAMLICFAFVKLVNI